MSNGLATVHPELIAERRPGKVFKRRKDIPGQSA